MALEVLEQIALPMLTTVETVKRRLRLAGNTDDALLSDLIAEASSEVVGYCRRPFARSRVRESGIKPDGRDLMLALTPVIAVHSVMRGGEPIVDVRVEDPDAGVLSASGGLLSEGEGRWWNDPFVGVAGESYDVEYTGGYLTPVSRESEDEIAPLARTLPHDLEAAVIELVTGAYMPDEEDRQKVIKSVKVDDITYQYENAPATHVGRSLTITDRLDRWRRAV